MSYWVYLYCGDPDSEDEDPACEVEVHFEGGTYNVKGTSRAELNVTYNYGRILHMTELGSVKNLDGRKASDVAAMLERVVKKLGTVVREDYWAPTPGNVGHMLSILLGWAKQHPDATFVVH